MALARLGGVGGGGGGGRAYNFVVYDRDLINKPVAFVEEPGSCLEEGACWSVNAV